jgi:hypothetical protein
MRYLSGEMECQAMSPCEWSVQRNGTLLNTRISSIKNSFRPLAIPSASDFSTDLRRVEDGDAM